MSYKFQKVVIRTAVCGLVVGLASGFSTAGEKAGYGEITGSINTPSKLSASEAYCRNIGDAAGEARTAWRIKLLRELEAKIEQRLTALDAKRQTIETWMRRRETFIERAQKNLVEIYTAMRPEAAAQQLTLMDDETAAAILLKLKPRIASAILNEIQPTRAARLVGVIAGSARTGTAKGKS